MARLEIAATCCVPPCTPQILRHRLSRVETARGRRTGRAEPRLDGLCLSSDREGHHGLPRGLRGGAVAGHGLPSKVQGTTRAQKLGGLLGDDARAEGQEGKLLLLRVAWIAKRYVA